MSWKKTLVWIWASVVLAFGTGCGITYNNDLPVCFTDLSRDEQEDYAKVIYGVHERLRIQPLGDITANDLLANFNKDVDKAFGDSREENPLVRQPTVNAIVQGVSAGRYEVDMVKVFDSDPYRYRNAKRRACGRSIAHVKQADAQYYAKAWGVREVVKQTTIAVLAVTLTLGGVAAAVAGTSYVSLATFAFVLKSVIPQEVSQQAQVNHAAHSYEPPRACR